jgi:DNA-binding CsgD family transcriptional regulator
MCYGNDHGGLRVMTAANDGRERAVSLAVAALFCAIAGLAAVDLALDLAEGTTIDHAVIEGVVVLVGLGGAGWMAARVRTLSSQAQELRVEATRLAAHLDASREEAARWRREASDLITGLSAAIDLQFERWQLTPAEKAVALLLLKGLSHKEVAGLREVSETTVRQQARAIYRKAGLTGRNDLAAFFLEDLLGPRG